jgi:hypothetical protein
LMIHDCCDLRPPLVFHQLFRALDLAVLLGGDPIRQRLTRYGSRDPFEKALKILHPKEAKEFKRRSARWPQMLKNLVFEPQSTH